MKKAIALFVLGIFLAGSAFGSVAVKEDGVYVGEAVSIDLRQMPQSSAISKSGSDIRIDFNYGEDTVTFIDEGDTPRTLLTTEGGTTFVLRAKSTGGKVITLPDVTTANDGLWYKIGGYPEHFNWTAPDSYITVIRPYDSGNTIRYTTLFSSDKDAPRGRGIAASKGMAPGADSYPTIKLVVVNGNWLVLEAKGTWAEEDQNK